VIRQLALSLLRFAVECLDTEARDATSELEAFEAGREQGRLEAEAEMRARTRPRIGDPIVRQQEAGPESDTLPSA
jgi:hypothetical protein